MPMRLTARCAPQLPDWDGSDLVDRLISGRDVAVNGKDGVVGVVEGEARRS
ncbi:MAG: hypothetical protein R2851_06750 [Caldilineaceae bacterium]